MDSLGCYGNLSSPWRKINHQHHQNQENPFSKEINTIVSRHISSPNPISVFTNNPCNNMVFNSLSPLMPDFGINISKTTASPDSLDCLLSATNSINNDTSVEDDGISVFFSPPQQASPPSFEITRKPSSSIKRTHDQMSQVLSFEGGENSKNSKKPRLEKGLNSSNISFQQPSNSSVSSEELDSEAIQHMKEMMYRVAAFKPVNLGVEIVEKPKRKNVKISSDPQTTAARERRERVSERIRVLQRLVPGGSKMDTASMLDEAANYLKFLRSQVKALESLSSSGQYYYKLDHRHLVNFGDQNLVNQGLVSTCSLFPMQNLFPHQTKTSLIHQAKD